MWQGLADVIRFWIDQGVTIFRVDNPHTKAFAFWEWAIGSIRRDHPETIFLAEAFTRPRVMERLAKIGFSQSYTYFTWRREAWELRQYFTDLATRTVDSYRPNAWPNTPDILSDQLQHGGRAMFVSRTILAATLSANWGIYGPAFELLEHRAIKPGSEEYLDSEKYQLRTWQLDDPESIAPLITRLNEIRRSQPALQHLRTLNFHDTDSQGLLCYSKTDPLGVGDPVLVVVNVDTYHRHAGYVHIDPATFGLGLGDNDEFEVHDLLGGGIYRWRGWHNYVDLTPGRGPAHVFAVRRIDASAPEIVHGAHSMTAAKNPKTQASRSAPAAERSDWFKDAVIYEIHVRAFQDANGDGTGDFDGLTSRLDYLVELGVTALWLLPFYPSPLRDDGYDIADYRSVNSDYGTMRSFKRFLAAAHARDLKVITELVINHTSDQHAWFQRARRAPAGSPERDFYVWTDDPTQWSDARIIFQDFEGSNWTWDPVAQQYYWHRFYSHQPDLNFDNPAVETAIMELLDYWLDLGVDGLRLDAIPYLYERDGTNCENLPETHAFLKRMRTHMDRNYGDRMFLAEANQWPEDAVAYFGDGDECHMNFHFPLMPRMFMAVQMENRTPITDILEQTPLPPDGCQWATFLRNHDELTLEMVTDEERQMMLRAYARDTEMRINLGIRRRLAPLLGNDRRKIELLNALLFSLPGTPVLYYGDEIGMGDNVYLGDRDGVRTPMQWSADRNGGFSNSNPHRLYLPLITEQGYHYESVNVDTQTHNPASLLSWMRQLIALRKRRPVMGRGAIEFLEPDSPHVLAFVRSMPGEESLLCVANLSRLAQHVELDLRDFVHHVPVEAFGQTTFTTITESPYHLTLAPYGFFWFSLRAPQEAVESRRRAPHPARVVGRGDATSCRPLAGDRNVAAEPPLVRRQGAHPARRRDRGHGLAPPPGDRCVVARRSGAVHRRRRSPLRDPGDAGHRADRHSGRRRNTRRGHRRTRRRRSAGGRDGEPGRGDGRRRGRPRPTRSAGTSRLGAWAPAPAGPGANHRVVARPAAARGRTVEFVGPRGSPTDRQARQTARARVEPRRRAARPPRRPRLPTCPRAGGHTPARPRRRIDAGRCGDRARRHHQRG